jgi:cytochrome c556
MQKMNGLLLAFTVGTSLLIGSEAMAQSDPMQIYKQRRQLMYNMQKDLWPMFEIKNGESTDFSKAAEGARAMSEAMSLTLTLFPVGTAKGEIPYTRARRDIWSDAAGFETAAQALKSAAARVEEAAKAGDGEVFMTQFDALITACTGCHELKPSGGGRYRFPLE